MKITFSISIILLMLSTLLAGCGSTRQDLVLTKKIVTNNEEQYRSMEATGELIEGVRVIRIKAYQFHFDPELIIINKGETIRLVIEAMDVPHGFEIEGFDIPGYDIDTVIRKGIPLELEFVADEEGVWEFICTIYCGYGHSTMTGTFVIR